jgi:hypothetical protein
MHRKRRDQLQELESKSQSCTKVWMRPRHWHVIDAPSYQTLTQKDFQLSQGRNRYELVLKVTKEEIEKCIPLCSNCHRDFHYLEKKDGISIEEYVNLKQNNN